MAITLLLLCPFVPILVGLGRVAGAIIVGLFAFLLALPLTVVALLEHWYPSPLVVRLIAAARTLATPCVAVTAAATIVAGSAGAAPLIFEGMRLLDYPQVLRGLSIVVLLALTIDMLLGLLQPIFSRTSERA